MNTSTASPVTGPKAVVSRPAGAPAAGQETAAEPQESFQAGEAAPRVASQAGPVAAAVAPPPPSPYLQQAQAIVAQTHAMLNSIAGSMRPLNEGDVTGILQLCDQASAALQALAGQAVQSGGQDAMAYIQSTLDDLATARQTYAALAGDIEQSQVQRQVDQAQTDAAGDAQQQQAEQDAANREGTAVNGDTWGWDETDDPDDLALQGDETPPGAPPPDPAMPPLSPPPGPLPIPGAGMPTGPMFPIPGAPFPSQGMPMPGAPFPAR